MHFSPVIPHSPVKISLKTEASPKKVMARVKFGLVACCGIKHDYTFKFLLLAFRTTWAGKKIQECTYGPSCGFHSTCSECLWWVMLMIFCWDFTWRENRVCLRAVYFMFSFCCLQMNKCSHKPCKSSFLGLSSSQEWGFQCVSRKAKLNIHSFPRYKP